MVVGVKETEGVTGHYTCSRPGHSLGSAFDINGAQQVKQHPLNPIVDEWSLDFDPAD